MNLELILLQLLNEVGRRSMTEKFLFNSSNLEAPQPVTYSRLRAALITLESKGQIASIQSEDRGTVYSITTEGEARILRR